MGTLTLNTQQQRRADILTRLSADRLSLAEAAQLLGVSVRQVRRLLARFQSVGLSSVVHGNTGRSPVHKTSSETLATLHRLAGKDGVYSDFNTSHLCEMLREQEDLVLGRSTLDRLLKQEKLRRRKRRQSSRVFRHRDRCSAEGQMLQIDASPHDWLQGRGARMSLLGAIDDATSQVVHAHFHPTEDQAGYLLMLREIALSYGLPESLYHDKHTILRSPKSPTIEEELAGKVPQSQFQQVLALLGIQSITAHSPQAKGRIERLWQTLQDRLIKEMRVAGVSDLQAANAFLPAFLERFNARFGVEPASSEKVWVPWEKEADLAYYFASREERTVKADHTLCWLGKVLRILRSDKQPSLAGKKVMVHTTPEGELHLYLGKQPLQYKAVTPPTPLPKNRPATPTKTPEAANKTATTASQKDVDVEAFARRNAWLHGQKPRDIFTEQI